MTDKLDEIRAEIATLKNSVTALTKNAQSDDVKTELNAAWWGLDIAHQAMQWAIDRINEPSA